MSISDHPLRLATGSHDRGTLRGCAMNLISWEQGENQISDTPMCVHWALARMVHIVNDDLCTHSEVEEDPSGYEYMYLCPDCSVKILSLAHRTVNTAGADNAEVADWLTELGHRVLIVHSDDSLVSMFKMQVNHAVKAYLSTADEPAHQWNPERIQKAKLRRAHHALDVWERVTGRKAPPPDTQAIKDAYRRMTTPETR